MRGSPDLLVEHREANSDTAYRKAIYLFALLHRIEDDAPGTLHSEVLERLESDTRLWHHRNPGVAAFTDSEVITNAIERIDLALDNPRGHPDLNDRMRRDRQNLARLRRERVCCTIR